MEEFTLPNVGASFKKWDCCTHILPKCEAHPHNTKKKWEKMSKMPKKEGYPTDCGLQLAVPAGHQPALGLWLLVASLAEDQRLPTSNRTATTSRWSVVARRPRVGALNYFSQNRPPSSCPHIFVHIVSTCWLAPTHARPAQTSLKIFKHP
jgi:hypothetical protein